jgi:hypothetical protein
MASGNTPQNNEFFFTLHPKGMLKLRYSLMMKPFG